MHIIAIFSVHNAIPPNGRTTMIVFYKDRIGFYVEGNQARAASCFWAFFNIRLWMMQNKIYSAYGTADEEEAHHIIIYEIYDFS